MNLYHPIGLVDPTMNNTTPNVHRSNVYGGTVDLVPSYVYYFAQFFYSAVNLDVDADPAPSILGLYIYICIENFAQQK